MQSDGFTVLDEHKLAALVTYLVHDLAAETAPAPFPEGFALNRLNAADVARYRQLFAKVGAEWLWFSRLRMPEPELRAILAAPAVEALALVGPAGDCGLLELDFRDPEVAELAYFGLVPEAVGHGLGRALMGEALSRAREMGVPALHVHTCTLDHPRALAFYCQSGFRPIRRAIEVFNDPRLDGTLPRHVAPWMPIIGG